MKPIDPIILSKENLLEEILQVCQKHKKEKRALAFAFLIYDFKDASINQVLDNTHWYSALDQIAGRYLTIFHLDAQVEELYKKRKQARANCSGVPDGYFGMMTAVTLAGMNTDLAMLGDVSERLGLKNQLETPFVLFFQTHDDAITDYFFVSLKSEEMEKSFLELKGHIKNAVEAISLVKEENFGNHQEIFNLIINEVKGGRFTKFISEHVFTPRNILPFIKLFIDRFFIK